MQSWQLRELKHQHAFARTCYPGSTCSISHRNSPLLGIKPRNQWSQITFIGNCGPLRLNASAEGTFNQLQCPDPTAWCCQHTAAAGLVTSRFYVFITLHLRGSLTQVCPADCSAQMVGSYLRRGADTRTHSVSNCPKAYCVVHQQQLTSGSAGSGLGSCCCGNSP